MSVGPLRIKVGRKLNGTTNYLKNINIQSLEYETTDDLNEAQVITNLEGASLLPGLHQKEPDTEFEVIDAE